MDHGKHSTYVSGCRCEDCRRANSDYQKKYRNTDKGRAHARRSARIQRKAQALALAYLRQTNKKVYFALYDMAKEIHLSEEMDDE